MSNHNDPAPRPQRAARQQQQEQLDAIEQLDREVQQHQAEDSEHRQIPTAEAERRPISWPPLQDRRDDSSLGGRKADRQHMPRRPALIGLVTLLAALSGVGIGAALVSGASVRVVVVPATPGEYDAQALATGTEHQSAAAIAASAKELALAAETTAETYATVHEGAYTNLSIAVLQKYESTLVACPQQDTACLEVASGSGEGYVVTTMASDGSTWSIERLTNGEIQRVCSPPTGQALPYGDCTSGTW